MNVTAFHGAARQAADLLKALANDRRLMILCLLSMGERTVGQLEEEVGLRQSALSQHLARLRRDGLVKTRRESQNVHYSLVGDEAVRVIETLAGIYCTAEGGEPRPKTGAKPATDPAAGNGPAGRPAGGP